MDSESISQNKKEENIQGKVNVDFNNIKSNIILKKIFDYLQRDIFLGIIKYNKKIQKRFNISIDDYKNYFSDIEIEIIPKKDIYDRDKFINYEKEEESFYHIYFNDNKSEKKEII